jgi:hypothetical protein
MRRRLARTRRRDRVYPFVVRALLISGFASSVRADEPVDFQRQIQPILAEHCVLCHGPDERVREAGLRLDVRDGAVSENAAKAGVIVPGKPQESELLRRVTATDPGVVMPPPEQKNSLEPEQIALLERWIEEGAPYEGHWAFTAPTRPPVPDLGTAATGGIVSNSKGPIDAFVADRLSRESLAFSPPALLAVLCRRIHLDVIGLPPSPGEVDAFVAAAESDRSMAISELVDRLLESEHFGEKWARHWLDVARYADTNGYEDDRERQQWAWRDWVVRAINADMPYDQFLVEQIAGDLLPDRTQDQLVATGFLRNSMINEEAGIVFEEFRMEGLFDRMDCIGKAVLGLSIQCAQCIATSSTP